MAPLRSTTTVVVALAFALVVSAQDLQINTPSGTYQCRAAQYSFTCPNPPCSVVARPSADATQQLKDFGQQDSTSGAVAWTPVDQPEGTEFTMWITDSQGNTISSAPVTVAAGSDDCLNGSASSGSGASGSSASASSSASGGADNEDEASSTSARASASGVASSAASKASSAASSAASGASSAASKASSAASSASESADAAAASASDGADGGNGAGSLVIKGSIVGGALLAASAALL
ncbi:hypothetical protein JCM11251_007207 [Rhodosporidiobolus azoricus]